MPLPTAADVETAARRLAGVALRTPLISSPVLDAATGARVFLKAETLQRTGSLCCSGPGQARDLASVAERLGTFAAIRIGLIAAREEGKGQQHRERDPYRMALQTEHRDRIGYPADGRLAARGQLRADLLREHEPDGLVHRLQLGDVVRAALAEEVDELGNELLGCRRA